MLKKVILSSLVVASSSFAASITSNEITVAPGTTETYSFDFSAGGEPVTSGTLVFDFPALPAGVTLGEPQSDGAIFTCQKNTTKVACILAKAGSASSIPDTTGFMTIEVTADATAADTIYTPVLSREDYAGGKANGSSIGDIVIKNSTTPVQVDFTCPTNATCSVQDGKVDEGTDVTVTPNAGFEVNSGGDGVAVTGKVEDSFTVSAVASGNVTFTCPANATCSIADGDYPADTDVTITPNKGYLINGSTSPVTVKADAASGLSVVRDFSDIGEAKPVPAIGLFGLFGLLASIFGAAAMVLRRK